MTARMNIEDLRLDAPVHSSDGHKLGKLSRFVVSADARRLTHVVIDTGILRSGESLWKGGWGLSHDRMVPLAAVQSAEPEDVRITMTAEEFREHSTDFAEEYFTQVPDIEPGVPDPSDIARLAMSIPGEPGPYIMQQVTAVAPGAAEIHADSAVWRLNPHQKIGEVERALFDADTGSLQALVIRRGALFGHDMVLPAERVLEVVAGVVRVDIDDAALAQLEEFRAERDG